MKGRKDSGFSMTVTTRPLTALVGFLLTVRLCQWLWCSRYWCL